MRVGIVRALHQREPFLDPGDLEGLRGVEFAPRRRTDGRFAGRRRTTRRGRSVEFLDFREYQPGDPVSDIDWKVYGRTDQLLVRQHEHQADLAVHALIDASASMAFSGFVGARPRESRSKFASACRFACAASLVAQRQHDRFALHVAGPGGCDVDVAASSMRRLIDRSRALEEITPSRTVDLPAAVESLAEARVVRRGVLVLLSDLHTERPPLLQALSRLAGAGASVIVVHTLHPHEIRLPDVGDVELQDSETGRTVRVRPGTIREAVERRVQEEQSRWRRELEARGMSYTLFRTDRSHRDVLAEHLVEVNRRRV